eukprot:TRINITY_DN46519_c0_g1_i1.p1 TRINITY_DN46519_c0_g1~~TRINITY_DN46519_c0_g1_i1.p1  ORF type:complete len:177 (-),score=56.44 TRINITY_DN46519_c0_g1_i1:44-574(-)
MAGLSARDYGGGLSTHGWEKAGPVDVRLTADDGLDDEVAQSAGIHDDDPNKAWLDQRKREKHKEANELAEFERLKEGQTKASKVGAAASQAAAASSAAAAAKRELPSFLKVKAAAAKVAVEPASEEAEAEASKRQRRDSPQPEAKEASVAPAASAAGVGSIGLGSYASDDESEEDD